MRRALLLVLAALAAPAAAQMFGRGGARDQDPALKGMSREEADHMQGTPQGAAAVDRAMQVRESSPASLGTELSLAA